MSSSATFVHFSFRDCSPLRNELDFLLDMDADVASVDELRFREVSAAFLMISSMDLLSEEDMDCFRTLAEQIGELVFS